MSSNATTMASAFARVLHLPITSDAQAFGEVARASERAVVRLGEPSVEHRSALAAFVANGIEAELARLGAAPAGWRGNDPLEAILGDQLYRARLLGCTGLAVSFTTLDGLADESGQLGPDDSQTLRRLLALAESEPLQLLLPRPCAELRVAGHPEPLASWLPPSHEPGRVATIEYELSADSAEAAPAAEGAEAPLMSGPPSLEAFWDSLPPPGAERPAPEETPAPPEASSTSAAASADAALGDRCNDDCAAASEDADDGEDAVDAKPASTRPDPERMQRCNAWAAHLRSMQGPRVHGSVEKAFITAYLPLCREISAGGVPLEAQQAAESWAEGFAQSYAAAFRQLHASTRRPFMVKDVVELGVRWLGLHRARQCQLLVVSGMRFDLGQRLNEVLERRLTERAACVDQCILWAALPSNADAQQLGEGAAPAARRPSRPIPMPRPEAPARGIESILVGQREVFKLNHLTADLAHPGEAEGPRLERLAHELAALVVPWILEQPRDTLVVVFGDHGFHWTSSPLGTGAAQRGGALPEQVLVSASGWLVREHRQRARVAPGVH